MAACILLNGDRPSRDFAKEIAENKTVYCCDGAANWACEYGIAIDVLMGDMDSIDKGVLNSISKSGIRLVQLNKEKDATDGEEAMDAAVRDGHKQIILLGATGDRLDHTIYNMYIMMRGHKAGCDVRALSENGEVFVTNSSFWVEGHIGTTLSIVPINDNVFVEKTEGLYYPFLQKTLRHDSTVFMSNRLTKSNAKVELSGGYVMVVITK